MSNSIRNIALLKQARMLGLMNALVGVERLVGIVWVWSLPTELLPILTIIKQDILDKI